MDNKFKSLPPKRPFFKVMYNEHESLPSAASTAAILGKALTGKTDDIIEASIENRGSLSAQNDLQQTVLHLLIENNKLSPDELYHQVVSAVEAGAPVDLPDKDGVRPIHLAARRQNLKIVKYLLSKHAEPNAQTNVDNTPLHYAVIPKVVNCEPRNKEEKDKREKIVSPRPKKIDKMIDILRENIQLTMSEPVFIKFLKHFGKMSHNNHFIVKNKADKQDIDDIFQTLLKNANKSDSSEVIRHKMMSEIKVIRERVYQRTLAELTNGLNPVTFKNDPDNAWGPIDINPQKDNPDNHVLYNFKGLQNWYLNTVEKDIYKSMNDAIDKINNRTTTMNANMQAISAELDKMKNVFNMFYVMHNYELFDTGDEMITHHYSISYNHPGRANILRNKNRKGLFNITTFDTDLVADMHRPHRLLNYFINLKQNITINNPDSQMRYDSTNSNNIFNMSLLNINPIDLTVHPVYMGKSDYLDFPPGSNRSMSDMARYYIDIYNNYIQNLKTRSQNVKNNYTTEDPNVIMNDFAYIQLQYMEMAYGNYLLEKSIYILLDIIIRNLNVISNDRWELYDNFTDRIQNVFNKKEIDEQIKAKNASNVLKLKRGESGNLVNDSEHVLLVRYGKGQVGVPQYNSTSRTPRQLPYYLLYNKSTKKINLVHLEYIYKNSTGQTQYYDRYGDSVIPHNIYINDAFYYETQKVPVGSRHGTSSKIVYFYVRKIDTPEIYDGIPIDIIQKVSDSVKKLLKTTYNLVVGGQSDLNEVIKAYNKVQGMKVLKSFHNDMNDNMEFVKDNITNYQNVLSAPLPLCPDLPKNLDDIIELITTQINKNLGYTPKISTQLEQNSLIDIYIDWLMRLILL